jgi:KDO2-lipid IV(A) lauroyltransferase
LSVPLQPWSPPAPGALDRSTGAQIGRAAASPRTSSSPATAHPVPAVLRWFVRAPLPALHAIGAALGWLGYAAAPGYRDCLRANLERAVPGATLRLRLAVAAQTGRGAIEALRVLVRPPAQMAEQVREVVGWEGVEEARRSGRGALLLSPHIGCVEILGPFLRDQPFTALYRPHRNQRLDRTMVGGRSRYARLAPADRGGVRAVLCALKRGELVLVLPDQVPAGGEGHWLPFFGRPAYTMTLAARLTELAGVESFLYCGERLRRGAGFRLHFVRPDPPLVGDTVERAAAINRNLETLILRHPDQYLWGYNRYKVPPAVKPGAELAGA